MRNELLDLAVDSAGASAVHHRLMTSSEPFEVNPITYRAGRQFLPTAELEIGPSLREAAWKLPTSSDSVVVMMPECPLPVGIPDLIVLVARRDALSARLRSGIQPVLAEQEARILSVCGPNRGAALEQLQRATGLSAAQVQKLLRRLVTSGALLRERSRWYRNEIMTPVGRIYALEAKVSDWRAGLSQSMRYSGYADASALALGKVSERVAAGAHEAAKRSSIGLYVDGAWLSRPRIGYLPAERRLWVSEHIVAALDHR